MVANKMDYLDCGDMTQEDVERLLAIPANATPEEAAFLEKQRMQMLEMLSDDNRYYTATDEGIDPNLKPAERAARHYLKSGAADTFERRHLCGAGD